MAIFFIVKSCHKRVGVLSDFAKNLIFLLILAFGFLKKTAKSPAQEKNG